LEEDSEWKKKGYLANLSNNKRVRSQKRQGKGGKKYQ